MSNWQRPTLTKDGKDCVEVSVCADGHVEIRNARCPEYFAAFTKPAWAAFITCVLAGEFDVLEGEPVRQMLVNGEKDGSVSLRAIGAALRANRAARPRLMDEAEYNRYWSAKDPK